MLACSTLAAAGSGKSGCPSCFADASERGVQVAVLLLFEARRSGYCVRACGGVKGVNPAFLVLAFSTGTLKGSGVPARPVQGGGFCASMLALVCSTPACPGLLVVVRFRAVHRCCLLGYCIPLSPSSLSCLHLCWLAAVRGAGGAFGAEGSWLLQVSRRSGCTSCFFGVKGTFVAEAKASRKSGCTFCFAVHVSTTQQLLSVRDRRGVNPQFVVLGACIQNERTNERTRTNTNEHEREQKQTHTHTHTNKHQHHSLNRQRRAQQSRPGPSYGVRLGFEVFSGGQLSWRLTAIFFLLLT